MRKSLILPAIFALVFVGIGIVVLTWATSREGLGVKDAKVAASIFPIYDIAQNIAGDEVQVTQVLPNGASPHTYEPTPADIARLQEVELALMIGLEFDDWMDEMLPETATTYHLDETVTLLDYADEHGHEHSDGEEDHADDEQKDEVENHGDDEHKDGEHNDDDHAEEEQGEDDHGHEHGEYDPHYWLSIDNAILIATSITGQLSTQYPESSEAFEANLANYLEELQELKRATEKRELSDKKVITFHNAYQYLEEDAGFEVITVVMESPGKEILPQELTELNEKVQEYEVSTIYSEPQLSSNALDSFAADNGLKIEVLDPLGGVEGRNSYIELIQFNLDQIEKA